MSKVMAADVLLEKGSGSWRELARLPWIPLVIFSVILFVTIFAPLLTSHNPDDINLQMRSIPPEWNPGGNPNYPLGTDTLGRDILTRIFYGGRVSLLVAIAVLAIAGSVGLALGIVAGYMQGMVQTVIMRVVDGLFAIPGILVALVFAMTMKPGLITVIIALSIVTWARFARVIRGQVLAVATSTFVAQAKVDGCSEKRIMLVHILPNVLNTFLVYASLEVGSIILMEATLSFLGAGIPPPTPSWGLMVSEGREYLTSAWWISFFPGLVLALTVFGVNAFGDWLRDRLDPKLRQL